ncbi:transposase [Paraglaciecola arctica]|uniref:transposase n=1 Tax=Paraglaciecola arctica TaxID=1128911 RepID=UPI00339D88BF
MRLLLLILTHCSSRINPCTFLSSSITLIQEVFNSECKNDAACLVLNQGYPYDEVSRAIDVHEHTSRIWVKQLKS